MMGKPLIILGAGGHSKVLIEILKNSQVTIIGITDPLFEKGTEINGIKVLGNDNEINNYNPKEIELINGIGFINKDTKRNILYEHFRKKGYIFNPLVHKSAILADDIELSEGIQILARAVLQPGSIIGENTIINTGAIIEHGSKVGRYSHVAPGAIILGDTEIGENSFIGAGAVIIQGVKIGNDCIVGAGGVIIKDVKDGATVVGVPAREVYDRQLR